MRIKIAAWLFALVICSLAVIAWGSSYQWHLSHLSTYQVFPLLGLLAFSLLWTQYIAGAFQRYFEINNTRLANYYRYTGYAVLVLICLHPGLLIYQRFRDGYGLPPGSYESYVAPGLGWVTLLGTASLLVFLAFELRRFFAKYAWWQYVAYASDAAMLAIAYHALRLGSQIHGWYRAVWVFYLVALIAALAYKYAAKLQTHRRRSPV